MRQAMNKSRSRRIGQEDENKKNHQRWWEWQWEGIGGGNGRSSGSATRHAGDWLTWDDVECPMPSMWDWLSGTEYYWLGRDVDLQQLEQVLGPLGHTQLAGQGADVLTLSTDIN